MEQDNLNELDLLSKMFSQKFGQDLQPQQPSMGDISSMPEDDLDALRVRYQQRAMARGLQDSQNPNADLGLKLAGGGIDLLSKLSNAQLAPVETLTGLKLSPSMQTNTKDDVQRAIASRESSSRQKALDDFSMLKSLEAIKAKRDQMSNTVSALGKTIESREEMQGKQQGFTAGESEKERENRIKLAEIAANAKKKGDEEIHGRELRQQVLNLSKGASTNADMSNTFKEVDQALGFNLDDYDTKKGSIKGSKVDLPGVNVPLLGRVSLHSRKARELDNVIARIFNIQLKDRSGAAVTPPEMKRLKDEWSNGGWNTEPEMIAGIQRAKRALMEHQKQIESGYDPKARLLYKKEGGILVDDILENPKIKEPIKLGKPKLTREQAIEIAKQRGLIKGE